MGLSFRPSHLSKIRKSFWLFFSISSARKSDKPLSLLRNAKGSAIILASILMIVAAFIVVAGAQLVQSARQQANQQSYSVAMAQNAAQAGLEDAIGWFKRQNNQPVAANPTYAPAPNPTPTYPVTIATNVGTLPVSFNDEPFYPVYNTTNPVSTDTIDPNAGTASGIGLVNEFSPDGAGSVSEATTDGSQPHWERYEVHEQVGLVPTPNAVHDITGERVTGKLNGQGLVWSLQSYGYYYLRKNFSKSSSAPYYWATSYSSPPNQILAEARMTTEIRKISMTMPWSVNAALYTQAVADVKTGTETSITNNNESNAYAWASYAAGLPVTGGSGEVHGSGITESSSAVNLSPNSVFGFQLSEFANLDTVVQVTANTNFSQTSQVPINSIIYCNGNLTIDPAGSNPNWAVIGPNGYQTGLLVVNGNFTLNSQASQVNNFYGLVYVAGSVSMNGSNVNGSMIVDGPYNVTLVSSNGNQASIIYSSDALQQMQSNANGYLEDISARRVFLPLPADGF